MKTPIARRFSLLGLVLVALLAVMGCGDDHHVRVTTSEGTIPEPGTFHGTTSLGGEISMRVGTIEEILLECGNTPILADFSPPAPIHDDGTFDVSFAGAGRSFRVDGIFTAQDAGHGRVHDGDHQCDSTFEVTRGPVGTEGPPSIH
ncbi:MAG: hypothetical protein E6J72_11625 [Deltaproteobacteria bacterium]|nr:MAG: hypothetical protein E6J72_11625 [Deltaproteobacteria bacterium]